VRDYLFGRRTLAAWQARQLIGAADADDAALRERLIEKRLDRQHADGSWGGDVLLTARRLRELAALGMTSDDGPIRRAAEWLIARPQSPYNPGMFFATDQLVEEQVQIIEQTGSGRGKRLRQLKVSEKRRVMSADDRIQNPCGPRIMWPTALVLDALLRLGYEADPRVGRALEFMTTQDWCECGYQNGLSRWQKTEPLTMPEIAAFEDSCIQEFRCGGFRGVEALAEADQAHRSHALRIGHAATANGDEYPLHMPDHIQGCEFITTRTMSQVKEAKMRRFAQAHLWRFAGIQRGVDGAFPDEKYGTGFGQAGILEAFARYDHPASKTVVWRSIPWIVYAQNGDGSWGEEPRKDVTTLSVLRALLSLGDDLPVNLTP
jgi:hypothetical protein